MDHVTPDQMWVAGKDIDLSLAITCVGDVQYELIEQHNTAPSTFRTFLDSHGEGLHHFCTWCEDIEANLSRWNADGHHVVMDGRNAGARFVFLESGVSPGTCVEVAEVNLPQWLTIMKICRSRRRKLGRQRSGASPWRPYGGNSLTGRHPSGPRWHCPGKAHNLS